MPLVLAAVSPVLPLLRVAPAVVIVLALLSELLSALRPVLLQ